jgi:hypothetical protein
MKTKWVGLAIGLSLAAGAFAQEAGPSTHKTKQAPAVDTATPVTEAEARATFKKVVANLDSLVGKDLIPATTQLADSTKPVTREAVINEFGHIYSAMSPSFKFTPRAIWYDPNQITIKSPALRKTLDTLIKQGFVSRVCPMVTSKVDTMSIDDFSYTLGVFVSRLADLTHMPDTKFTPILVPG